MKQTIRPKGINHDIDPSQLDSSVWNSGKNVIFQNGYATAAPGWNDAVGNLLFSPLWILPVITPTLFYWIYCGNTLDGLAGGIGVTDGANHFDITPIGLPATVAGDWTGGTLNGVACFNGIGFPPLWWDGDTGNPAQELPGWIAGETCKALRPFKNHLIAMNITAPGGDFGDLVKWSSAADTGNIPDSWTPESSNDAGSFSIATTQGFIVDGGALRDQFVIYKQHSTTMMQFIAGSFVFSNRKAFTTSGILARNCWAEMYGAHYVITDGDFIRHNGQEVASLADGVNRKFIFDGMDESSFASAFLAASHANKEVWLCWPEQGNELPNIALVFDIKSGVFGISDLPNIAYISRGILNDPDAVFNWEDAAGTWQDKEGQWNQRQFNPTDDLLVMAQPSATNPLLLAQDGFLRLGELVPIFLQLRTKDFNEWDAAGKMKTMTSVWNDGIGVLDGSVTGEFHVRVGTQKSTQDAISWQPRAPRNPHYAKNDMIASDQYLSLELSGRQADYWQLLDLAIDFELSGNA